MAPVNGAIFLCRLVEKNSPRRHSHQGRDPERVGREQAALILVVSQPWFEYIDDAVV